MSVSPCVCVSLPTRQEDVSQFVFCVNLECVLLLHNVFSCYRRYHLPNADHLLISGAPQPQMAAGEPSTVAAVSATGVSVVTVGDDDAAQREIRYALSE